MVSNWVNPNNNMTGTNPLGQQIVQPDGSSLPGSVTPTAVGGGSVPGMPNASGPAAAYNGASIPDLAFNTPNALIWRTLGVDTNNAGQMAGAASSPLAAALNNVADANQLNTLYALLSTGNGAAGSVDGTDQLNWLSGFYNSMANPGSALPTLPSLFGSLFHGSGDNTGLGMLFNQGTAQNQASTLLSAISNMAQMNMNPLVARALMNSLQVLGSQYMEAAGRMNANSTGQPSMAFSQWLQRNAPQITQYLGG